MNGINGPTAPKYTYLVFYSSVVNGKMWCPVSFLTTAVLMVGLRASGVYGKGYFRWRG
jgi:hypothetical protein